MSSEAINYATEQAFSRLVPSIVSDIAKATDVYERVGGKGLEGVKARIPGLRQTLKIRTNIFGEQIEGEAGWSDIIFGARVKTSKENELIKEVSDISNSVGKGINFTDWDKSTSKTLTQFKEKVGDEKFDKAKYEYGQELKKQLEDLFKKPAYQKLSDEDKYKAINDKDTEAMNKIFKKYAFKYKPEKSNPLP